MTTAAEIVRASLLLLRVLDKGEAPEADDMQDAIAALNRMCANWESKGLAIGWTRIDTPAEVLTSPPEADDAIIYNLALRLRPSYGATLEPDVVAAADSLRKDVVAAVFSANPIAREEGFPLMGWGYNTRTDGWGGFR